MKPLLWVLFALAVLPPVSSVSAQGNPTPTPTPVIITEGIKTKKDFNEGGSFNEREVAMPTPTPTQLEGDDVTLKFGGDTKMANFKYFNLKWWDTMMKRANRVLQPGSIKDKMVPVEPNKLYISVSQVKQCTHAVNTSGNENYQEEVRTSESNAITKPLPILAGMRTGTIPLASMFTKYKLAPNASGKYDLNEKSPSLETIEAPPCEDGVGTDQNTQETTMVRNFGFIDVITRLFAWFKDRAEKAVENPNDIAVRTLSPYTDTSNCLTSGCKTDTPGLSYQPEDEAAQVKDAGGISRSFLPNSIDPMLKCDAGGANCTTDEAHGQHINSLAVGETSKDIKTRTEGTKEMENYANAQRCMLLPKSKQSVLAAGVDCTGNSAEAVSCELPELGDDYGACGLCNADSLMGPLARKILGAAGKAFNVPAANIWAAMWHEGGTWADFQGKFTDENVRKWSLPKECGGEPMPRCDDSQDRTQPPFGWIKVWFYKDNGPWTAVKSIDAKRNTKDKVNRCNFLDAAFATAKALQENSSMQVSGKSCGIYSFDNTRPGSCSSWTDAKIAQSQVGYVGQCPNVGQYEDVPYTIETVVSIYKTHKCQ